MKDEFAKTGVLPSALANRPSPFADVRHVWDAFSYLTRFRQYSDTGIASPISFSEISCYMEHRAIFDPDDRDEFIQLITVLDDVFIADTAKKAQARIKK